ncbi:MAG TPA: alpha/beta fold hydrolase [Methylomirabilota bacterium]|jgi:aminoacrylate hydrolase|nr:alpha/beta fold hydrolase [Methylomirabilota bacterium]
MPTYSIGDAEIYYEESGTGAPLLLVPGLSGLGSFWTHQVAELERDFRVIVHDHRGAGRSTHSRIKYSVEQMADDLLRLMDGFGIDNAHLVGHSTGGAIGQVIAQDHPARLRSLVLSATWPGEDAYFRRLFESRKQVLLDSGVEAYLRASVLMLAPPWWVSANDAAIAQSHKATAAASAPVDVMTSRIDAIMAFDRRARLAAIRVPTLVIVAQDDMVTPRFYSDELAGTIPGAQYVVLDGGGHFAPQITPEPYNRAVSAFLRAIVAADR